MVKNTDSRRLIHFKAGKIRIKFAEYIKFLGTHYDRQTIMVTHNDNLSNVADKTFVVTKNTNGISQASALVPAVNFWDILDTTSMEEALNDEN